MSRDGLWKMTAVEAVARLKKKEISPLDLVEASAKRMEEVEPAVNAMPTLCLDRARTGIYPMMRSASIPHSYLKRFMLKGRGEQAGKFAVGQELRDVVTFRQINLHEGPFAAFGMFDLVLCRNVLIYFTGEGRARVLRSLTDQLAPGGRLFLGHAETLNGVSHTLRTVVPTIYGAPEA